MAALDPRQIRVPRIPRRDVLYLTKEEVEILALDRRDVDVERMAAKIVGKGKKQRLLLFNGCPIGHIKELLGHERLDTTCRYYLGVDARTAKEARQACETGLDRLRGCEYIVSTLSGGRWR